MESPIKEEKIDFINICGCPRSGSYILQLMINKNFPISFPTESHFLPLFQKYAFLWGDLARPKNRRRLLNAIYDFIEIFTHSVLWSKVNPNLTDQYRFTLLATKPHKERIITTSKSFPDLVSNLFREYAHMHGVSRWGDKSSFFDPVPLETIANAVPKLKVIHIIRDGRDVCLSWQKTWHGPATVVEAAHLWSNHIKQKRAWGKEHPEQYIEVRYEEFTANINSELGKIGTFIDAGGTNDDNDLYFNDMTKLLSGLDSHKKLSGGIVKNNVEKWRKKMSESDIKAFESVAGETLYELGYELQSFEPGKPQHKINFLNFILGMLPHYLTPLYWRRKAKYLLPLIIFLAQFAQVSLPKLIIRKVT